MRGEVWCLWYHNYIKYRRLTRRRTDQSSAIWRISLTIRAVLLRQKEILWNTVSLRICCKFLSHRSKHFHGLLSIMQAFPRRIVAFIQACPWKCWCHEMETVAALLALCEGNPPVTGGFLYWLNCRLQFLDRTQEIASQSTYEWP